MRFQFLAGLPAVAAILALGACATAPAPTAGPYHSEYRAPQPPPAMRPVAPSHLSAPGAFVANPEFSRLPGWAEDDHAAALAAFVATCRVAQDPGLYDVCRRAIALGRLNERDARRFLETNFRPEAVPEEGLLTAYFAPVYEARSAPEGPFTAPVRPRPADLPPADWTSGQGAPYADRAQIDQRPTDDALAWMRPEDLFFLQIQGSGVLVYPDGGRAKAVFDGTNGARFQGIAAPMREQGLLADDSTSGEAIRTWLAQHQGPRAQALMQINPRYVFFKLGPDDGRDPAGAAGQPLIPGRAVAVDTSKHALGELFWIDASAPALAGAFPTYRRLTVALDAGGAIKGEARADLYLGRGPEAGLAAGRVRHTLRLYRLAPVTHPSS
ncbi:MAG TPA: MltA domain-containing protein [Caulobacteraceae bacterium]